ncbi:MAG TPA: hypothetical protein VJ767_00810 [Nitrososphaeraceae archaeon]|nr:hypothetical protein [Nitrososphaeraceae archaeon]
MLINNHIDYSDLSFRDENNDDHIRIFGKKAIDVDYNLFGYCDFCNTRIDEFGFCACSGGAAD